MSCIEKHRERTTRQSLSDSTHYQSEGSRRPTGTGLSPVPADPVQLTRILPLFLDQAGVAGDANPLRVLENPGIRESPEVFVWLAGVQPFGVVITGHHGRRAIQVHFKVLDTHQAGLEFRIGEVREKFAAVADLSVVLGVNKAVADHGSNGGGITAQLRLVPHSLERDQGCFGGTGVALSLRECADSGDTEKNEACDTQHGAHPSES